MADAVKLSESAEDTEFGDRLAEGLSEALAWRRGEISLPVRIAAGMTPERIRAIRKAVAKSPTDFAKRFGIPARTLEGWEQGRRQPDPAASVLLRVIEKNPAAVEAALG